MASAAAQTSPIEKEFLAVPTTASARASLKHITSRPHVAGTPGDLAMAQFVHDQIKAAGIDIRLVQGDGGLKEKARVTEHADDC